MLRSFTQKSRTLSRIIFAVLIIYMPFHVFLAILFGDTLGVLELAKVAKDVVLAIGFGLAVVGCADRKTLRTLTTKPLLLLSAFYVGFYLLMTLTHQNGIVSEILGVVYNVRFLVFMFYGALLSAHYGADFYEQIKKLIIGVSVIVSAFGIFQVLFLPNDALIPLGFIQENGVQPVFYIDETQTIERAMSTLRDPNSLGAYLLIPLFLIVSTIRNKKSKPTVRQLLTLAILLTCISLTFSRSAWIALLAAIFTYGVIEIKPAKAKQFIRKKLKQRRVVLGTLAGVLSAIFMFFYFSASPVLQNIIFHTNSNNPSISSNEARVGFWQNTINQVTNDPFGKGPGSAGPESVHNELAPPSINESYYLQVALSMGLFGLVIFLAILFETTRELLKTASKHPDSHALVALFIGMAVVNVFTHAWSNEVVALLMWGLIGLLLGLSWSVGNSRRATLHKK